MRGVNTVIGEILLISIVIVIISFTMVFYQTTLYKTGNTIEKEEESRYCDQMSNFMISEVVSRNITVVNTGGTELNLDNFFIYISGNKTDYTYSGNNTLDIGGTVTFRLAVNPPNNSQIKIIGDCNSGDIFVVGSIYLCGDGYCDSAIGENVINCAKDCS